MSANRLYHTWLKQIQQLRPGERITRLRLLAWLMVGIYLSRSVHLSRIGLKIPGKAKAVSTVRRPSRFPDNSAIRVREWYKPIAQRHLVDRPDRRDLSLFQIGLRLVERCLTNDLPIPIRLLPAYGGKLSGG